MLPRFPKLITYLSLLLLGGVFLGPLVTYATLTLDSTSITTDDTLKLKGGNVGVGNITPTSNLHVSGTLTVTATSTLSGASTLTGAVTLSNPSTNSLIYTNSTGVVTALASSTAGKVLMATSTAPYFSWETSSGGITSLGGLTGATQTFATSSDTNIELKIGSSGTTHTFTSLWAGVLPISRGGTNTSTALTAGSVLFSDGTAITQNNSGLFWDNTNTRLGIGAISPSSTLHVVGTSQFTATSTFSGRVAIGGAITPSSTLHVSGTLRFTDGNQAVAKALYSDASGNATWQTASTTEYAYNQSTTNITVSTATTTIITADAVTFDGSTPVIIQFYTPRVTLPAALQGTTFSLFDGSTVVSWLGYVQQAAGTDVHDAPVALFRRLTPSAASHTYSVRGLTSSGNTTVTCGTGSGEAHPPCFIRIIKAN